MTDILQFIVWGSLAFVLVQHRKGINAQMAMNAIDCLAWLACVMAIISIVHAA